ncbi:MAG: nucleotidyltransferase domain-containing protein [Burkholderiaceae bacterium]
MSIRLRPNVPRCSSVCWVDWSCIGALVDTNGWVDCLAAAAFKLYRRRGGKRLLPLPDFFIGAHAAVAGSGAKSEQFKISRSTVMPVSENEAPSASATDLLAPLRGVLSQFPYISLAVLFGSVASGRARADSDVDLAVSASRPLTAAEMLQITQALAETTGRPVDLIDLSNVSAPLLGQILRHGKRVQGSVAEFGQLINRHLIEQADFMPLLNRVLGQRRMAWIGK